MDLFPKELLHGFCPKFEISRMGVFYKNYVTKNRFSIFWIENKHSKTKKIDVLTRAKNGHFLKGLVHGFCRKMELFLIGVFYKNHIRKPRFLYCRQKRMILSRKKLKFYKRTKNGHFPRGLVNGFCPKIELSVIAVFYRSYVIKDRFQIFLLENNHLQTTKLKF